MNYEWDPEKATSNLRKHGISFEDATVVFEDTYALEDYDTDHSMSAEKRFTRLGLGKNGILYIVYTLRANYPGLHASSKLSGNNSNNIGPTRDNLRGSNLFGTKLWKVKRSSWNIRMKKSPK